MNMLSGIGRGIGTYMMNQEAENKNNVDPTKPLNLTDADLGIDPNNMNMTVGQGANAYEAYVPTALDAVNNGIDYSGHFTAAGRTAPPPDPLAILGQNNFAMNLSGPAGLVSSYPYLG
jgi:hypothetical protein